jgi:hypothetical protein
VHGIDPKDLTHAPSFAEKVRSRQLRSLPQGASGSATSFCRHFFSPSKFSKTRSDRVHPARHRRAIDPPLTHLDPEH